MLEVIESNISTSSPNIHALQLDQQDLQSTLDTLCGKTSELSLISSSKSSQDMLLQSEINDIIGRAYSQLRSIKLYVKECQNINVTPLSVSTEPQTAEIQFFPSTNVENATSSNVQTSMAPVSVSKDAVTVEIPSAPSTNVENTTSFSVQTSSTHVVIDSDSSSAMNVSASEFTPTTTLPEASASNPYPVATSVALNITGASLVIPQMGVNMGQASFDPGQNSNDIHLHPNTNTLEFPSPPVIITTPFHFSGTSAIENLPPPVNPPVITLPQYPGSNIMFYPSTNVNTSISPLQYPYTHSNLSQRGTTTIPSTISQSLSSFAQSVNSTTGLLTSDAWLHPAHPISDSSESDSNRSIEI